MNPRFGRRLAIVPILMAVGIGLTITQVARGQSTPSAQSVLTESVVAVRAAGSAHTDVTMRVTLKGAKALGVFSLLPGSMRAVGHGDVQWKKPGQASLAGALQLPNYGFTLPSQIPTTYKLVRSGEGIAVRAGQLPWICRSLKTTKVNGGLQAAAQIGTGLLPKAQLQPAVTIGGATVNGNSVWHIQRRGTVLGASQLLGTRIGPVTYDLYIAQGDHTLRRFTASLPAAHSSTDTVIADFTQYGKAVSVSLPAACPAHPSTLASPLVAPATALLLDPASVLSYVGLAG